MKKIFLSIFLFSVSLIAFGQSSGKAAAQVFAPEPQVKKSGTDAQKSASEKIIFTEKPQHVQPQKTHKKTQSAILFTSRPDRILSGKKNSGEKSK